MNRIASGIVGGLIVASLAAPAYATTPNGHILPSDKNRLQVCGNRTIPQCAQPENVTRSKRVVDVYPQWDSTNGVPYGIRVKLPKGHTSAALYYEPAHQEYVYFFKWRGLTVRNMAANERVKIYYFHHTKRAWITRCKPKGDSVVRLPERAASTTMKIRVVTTCQNRG